MRAVALAATVVTGITTTLSQPFFPDYVAGRYHVSAATVGLIVAGCPSAQVLSTPMWTWLMGRVGRRKALLLGSLILTTGTVIFALAPSIAFFVFGRVLQGVGSQGAYASSIALIMEVSDALAVDMGTIELTWGLGYMLGPPIGGVAFQLTGFVLAHAPAACLSMSIAALCLYIICRWGSSTPTSSVDPTRGKYVLIRQEDTPLEDDCEHEFDRTHRQACGTNSVGQVREEAAVDYGGSTDSKSGRGWSRLLNASVFAVSLGIIGHAAVQGFKEITLAKHLRLALGANAAVSGMVFMWEPLVYSVVCIIIGYLASDEGLQSRTMLWGLGLYGLGLYGLAVPSVFVDKASDTHRAGLHVLLPPNAGECLASRA